MDHNSKCKLLDENIGENLGDIGFGEDFLDTTSKAQFMKEIKWCYTLSLKLLLCKRHLLKWKASHRLRKNTCKAYLIRELYPKYTELLHLNNKKTSKFKNKWKIWRDT